LKILLFIIICLTIIVSYKHNIYNTTIVLQITIKLVEGKEGEYVAYNKFEFLNVTYFVYFRNNIFGSVALNEFSEMVKSKYRESNIDFII